jgi:hypothetical protein
MTITTIALAIALTLPSTFARARGGMSMGSRVTRPSSTVGAAGRIANQIQECFWKYASSHRA